jgi:hypothetical protein
VKSVLRIIPPRHGIIPVHRNCIINSLISATSSFIIAQQRGASADRNLSNPFSFLYGGSAEIFFMLTILGIFLMQT